MTYVKLVVLGEKSKCIGQCFVVDPRAASVNTEYIEITGRRTQFCFQLNFLDRIENAIAKMTVRLETRKSKGTHSIIWFGLPTNYFHYSVVIDEELSDEEVLETNEVDRSSENDSNSDDEMEADNDDDQEDEVDNGNDEEDEVDNGDDQEDGADNEDDQEDEEGDDAEGNVGWANTFAKVLQQEKPKNKKYLVLSRAKKLSERAAGTKETKPGLSFEIDGKKNRDENDDADSNEESDVHDDDLKPSSEDLELAMLAQKERNNKLNELRVKPSVMDRERERAFKRIATKGVVQLFNAVRSQQKDLVDRLEKAGPLDHKRDAVLNNINKRQFLDVLMGGKRAKSKNIDNPVKEETVKGEPDADDGATKPSQWSVLRDDFMTNKKIASHWDNDDEDDGGGDNVNGGDGGDDSDWNCH